MQHGPGNLQRELSGHSPARRAIDSGLPRMLEMISRNIALEPELIDDLLDLSRLVQGELPLQPDLVDARPRPRHPGKWWRAMHGRNN